jgi:outer membrane receptor protein involved in Fe transport
MKFLLPVLCFFIMPFGIFSQNTNPIYLEEVEITSSRSQQLLKNTPAIVRVISKTEIESIKPRSTSEVLDYVAGITIETGTGSGLPNRGIVSLNGYPAQYCLILVNGTRLLTEHIHTGQNINLIPVNEIERIEIIKGAGSNQYGSSALGGVINIITKDGKIGNEAMLYASGGSYNTYNGGLSVKSRINDKISSYTFTDWVQTDGVPLLAPAHRLGKMSYNSLNLTQRINANITDKLNADTWIKYVRTRMDWGDGENFSYLFIPNLNLNYKVNSDLSIHVKAAYTEWFNETATEKNQLTHPELWANWNISEDNNMVFGGDYSIHTFTRSMVETNTQRAVGIFVQDQQRFNENFAAELGLRVDLVQEISPVVTPKLALLYRPIDFLGVRLGYSRGFKAPTPQEMYEEGYGHSGAALRFGNPDLKPEFSHTGSIGLDLNLQNKLFIDASAYYSKVNNMIVPVYEGPWYEVDSSKDVWRRQNILEANILSGQIGVRYLLFNNYGLHMSYSYSDNFTPSEENRQLPYKPGQSLSVKITGKQNITSKICLQEFVSLRTVTGRSAWNWKPASGIVDDASGLITALEDYQKLDAGITISYDKKYDLYFNVSNILGQDIQNLDDALTIIDGEPVFSIGFRLILD